MQYDMGVWCRQLDQSFRHHLSLSAFHAALRSPDESRRSCWTDSTVCLVCRYSPCTILNFCGESSGTLHSSRLYIWKNPAIELVKGRITRHCWKHGLTPPRASWGKRVSRLRVHCLCGHAHHRCVGDSMPPHVRSNSHHSCGRMG